MKNPPWQYQIQEKGPKRQAHLRIPCQCQYTSQNVVFVRLKAITLGIIAKTKLPSSVMKNSR